MLKEIISERDKYQALNNSDGFDSFAFFAMNMQRPLLDKIDRILRRGIPPDAHVGIWEFVARVYALNAQYDKAEYIYRRYIVPDKTEGDQIGTGNAAISDLLLQLSSHCDLSCRYCPRSDKAGSCSHMEPKLLFEILRQIKDKKINVRQITLNQAGESFLHPEFFNILKEIRSLVSHFQTPPKILLFTNGQKMKPEHSKRLIEMDIIDTFIWSVDGVDKCSYERIRSGGHYDVVLRNLESFLEISSSKHKTVIYNMLDRHCKLSVLDPKLQSVFEMADKVAVRFPASRCRTDYGYYIYGPYRNKGICCWGRNQVVINSHGKMCLCSIDLNGDTAFADLNHTTFAEAYFNKRTEILKRMERGRKRSGFDLCRRCPMTDNTYEPTFGIPLGPESIVFYRNNLPYFRRSAA